MNFLSQRFFKSLTTLSVCLSLVGMDTAYGDTLSDISIDAYNDGSVQNSVQNDTPDLYLQALKAINEKRHVDAKILLEKLIESEPQHAGALLDLAIMQCNLGNQVEAERLFSFMINRFTPPPAILEIIELHGKTGCVVKSPEVSRSFSAERGYDTNANQGALNSIFTLDNQGTPINLQLLPEYLPKPDHYMSVALDLSQEKPDSGNSFYLQLRGRQYATLHQFNSAGIAAGMTSQYMFKDWTVRPSASVNVLTLANALYQKQMTGRISFDPPQSSSPLMKWSLVASASRILYPTIKNFDGSIFEIRAIASKQAENYYLNINTALMYDQGNEQRLGGNRLGWSAGSFFRSATPLRLWQKPIFIELGLQHQSWQNEKIYLSGLINVKKHQNNNIVRAALGWALDQENILQLEYRQISNRENISFLSFNSRQIQLSWQWQK
jgi:hypothetical protein